MGGFDTTPKTLPTIILGHQDTSTVSAVSDIGTSSILTSSGEFLTWGSYRFGTLGLGDPGKLPIGLPGGYVTLEERQAVNRICIPSVTIPTEVRFDHGLMAEGRVKRYCFAVAMRGNRAAALVVNLVEDEVPSEGLKLHSQMCSTVSLRPW